LGGLTKFPVDVEALLDVTVAAEAVLEIDGEAVVVVEGVLSLTDIAAMEAVAAAATEAKLVGFAGASVLLLLSDGVLVEVEEAGDLIIGLGPGALRGMPFRKGLPAAGAPVGFLLPSVAAVLGSGVDDMA
jgi:hypothetical protein